MRKTGLALLMMLGLLVLFAVGAQTLQAANADEAVTVYNEELYDSNNNKYGVNFYVDSTVNGQVYVTAGITSRENVTGDVIFGALLMQSNEKHVRVGSFVSADRSKAWSVDIHVRWSRAD